MGIATQSQKEAIQERVFIMASTKEFAEFLKPILQDEVRKNAKQREDLLKPIQEKFQNVLKNAIQSRVVFNVDVIRIEFVTVLFSDVDGGTTLKFEAELKMFNRGVEKPVSERTFFIPVDVSSRYCTVCNGLDRDNEVNIDGISTWSNCGVKIVDSETIGLLTFADISGFEESGFQIELDK